MSASTQVRDEMGASRPAPSRLGTIALCLVMFTWILSFTPEPQVLGTVPAMVAALALMERCRKTRHALGYVAVFGAVAIGYGYRWLGPTVREFGEFDDSLGVFSAPVSWLVLGVYGIAGTIHGLLFVVLYRWTLRSSRRPHPLLTVALFVACETLPIRFLPWMAGYGAVDVAPLRQAAEWGGVPAVSFALLCLVVPIHEGLVWALSKTGAPGRPKAALATFAIGVAIYAVGWVRYHQVTQDDLSPPSTLKIGVVQSNVGSTVKRDTERGERLLAKKTQDAFELDSKRAADAGAELIVWPETAIVQGLRIWDAPRGAYLPLANISASLHAAGYGFVEEVGRDRAMLLGGYEDEQAGLDDAGRPATVRYNAAMLREAGGSRWSIYKKTRLIPFGESMPFSDWIPALRKLLPQSFRMVPGPASQPPIVWKDRNLTLCCFICYEAILPDVVRELAGESRPDLLVNLTNDSWYGDSWEPRQHLNFARFRAVEHRAPLVRATNTGISAFIDAAGDVLERSRYNEEAVLVRDVPIVPRGRTLFAQFGGIEKWALWILAAFGVLWTRLRPPLDSSGQVA